MIIQQAVWLYARLTLSFRDIEDRLAERGIMMSYETVHRWVTDDQLTFDDAGPSLIRPGLDEVFQDRWPVGLYIASRTSPSA